MPAHSPRDLAEQALAHRVGDATEQAYRRSDALEKRQKLMEAWAVYCDGGAREATWWRSTLTEGPNHRLKP